MSFPYPAKPWSDGQTFTVNLNNRYVMTGTYFAAKNVWSFVRTDLEGGVDAAGDIYTPNVLSLNARPDEVAGAVVPFADPNTISNQQDINWHLLDLVGKNAEELAEIVWFSDTAPELNEEGEVDHVFWFDTSTLELLIYYNEQWFPVSIPPAQVNVLKEVIEGLEVSVTQVRGDIAKNKIDIDELGLDLREERDVIKTEIDGKIATLEEELEQLAPSLERGSWNFTLNHPPGVGEYTMIQAFLDEDDQEDLCTQTYTECTAAAAGDPSALAACNREWADCKDAIDGSRIVTTNDWTQCDELVFNDTDANGVLHNWAGIDSDHYIDVFNTTDADFMVGDIAIHGSGSFKFDLISSRGVATGLATIKIFKTEGTVDFDQYVRKAGDTMTGLLTFAPTVNPTLSNHATHKRYVDEQVGAPTTLGWKVTTEDTSNPLSGEARFDGTNMSNSTEARINFTSKVGNLDLYGWTDNKTIYSGDGSHFMLSAYYTGSDVDYKWRHKGFANITKIETYKRKDTWYFLVKFGDTKTANGSFSGGGTYYLTIPGLF